MHIPFSYLHLLAAHSGRACLLSPIRVVAPRKNRLGSRRKSVSIYSQRVSYVWDNGHNLYVLGFRAMKMEIT